MFSFVKILSRRQTVIITKNIWSEWDSFFNRVFEIRGENEMPDVSKTEIGRRFFLVHREKRVEQAIKKIKYGVGPEWKLLTTDEIQTLGHLLQCTWHVIDQKVWDTIPFAKMTKTDVDRILGYGEGVCPGNNPSQDSVEEIKKILMAVS